MARFLVCLAACAALAGCNASYGFAYRGGSAMVQPTTTVVQGGTIYYSSTSASAGAVAGVIGLLGFALHSDSGSYYRVNANPFAAITSTEWLPALDPERRVNEQDCTQPIEDWSANLRCK
jgi:hypothetical protein